MISYFASAGPRIQNELLSTIAFQVKKTIVDKVKMTTYFPVIFYCSSDASHQEQVSLVLRYVDVRYKEVKVTETLLTSFRFRAKLDEGYQMLS